MPGWIWIDLNALIIIPYIWIVQRFVPLWAKGYDPFRQKGTTPLGKRFIPLWAKGYDPFGQKGTTPLGKGFILLWAKGSCPLFIRERGVA